MNLGGHRPVPSTSTSFPPAVFPSVCAFPVTKPESLSHFPQWVSVSGVLHPLPLQPLPAAQTSQPSPQTTAPPSHLQASPASSALLPKHPSLSHALPLLTCPCEIPPPCLWALPPLLPGILPCWTQLPPGPCASLSRSSSGAILEKTALPSAAAQPLPPPYSHTMLVTCPVYRAPVSLNGL